MLTGLIITGAVIVGVLLYSTIGVTTQQITESVWSRRCERLYSKYHAGNLGKKHHCDHFGWSVASGIFWIAAVPVIAVWVISCWTAKGPSAWGTWLAELPNRDRRALSRLSPDELHALEVECGLTDG